MRPQIRRRRAAPGPGLPDGLPPAGRSASPARHGSRMPGKRSFAKTPGPVSNARASSSGPSPAAGLRPGPGRRPPGAQAHFAAARAQRLGADGGPGFLRLHTVRSAGARGVGRQYYCVEFALYGSGRDAAVTPALVTVTVTAGDAVALAPVTF